MDFEGLLKAILQLPRFKNWVQYSAGHWRDGSEKNPSAVLSVKGMYDHKKGTSRTLISVAEENGIDWKKHSDKKNDRVTPNLPSRVSGSDSARKSPISEQGSNAPKSAVPDVGRDHEDLGRVPSSGAGGATTPVQKLHGESEGNSGVPAGESGVRSDSKIHGQLENAIGEFFGEGSGSGDSERAGLDWPTDDDSGDVLSSAGDDVRRYSGTASRVGTSEPVVGDGEARTSRTDSSEVRSGEDQTPKRGPKDTTWNDPSQDNENIMWRYGAKMLPASESRRVVARYLEARGLPVLENILAEIRPRSRRAKSKHEPSLAFEICVPLLSLQGKIGALLVIQLSNEFKKIRKLLYGKPTYDVCVAFGSDNHTYRPSRCVGFEGLENALAWYAYGKDENPATCLVSCGCVNFKRLTPFFEGYDEKTLILDPDEHNASLLHAQKLSVEGLTQLLPGLPIDANDAHIQGKMGEWLSSLKNPTPNQITDALIDAKDECLEENDSESTRETIYERALDEYGALILRQYKEMRKDPLTSDVFFRAKGSTSLNEWIPQEDAIKALKFRARTENYTRKKNTKWSLEAIEPAMEVWRQTRLPPQLLITIPEWDGVERIKQICDKVSVRNFDPGQFYEIVAEWLARAYLRINNPSINQHFLILLGGQGRGKDWVIDALTGGLGHYAKNIILEDDQTRIERAISGCIIARIAEFDKANHVNVAILKDVITKPVLNFDEKFIKGLRSCQNRTSFIGSANELTFIRDVTGNRRYRFVEIEDIDLVRDEVGEPLPINNYPGDVYDPKMIESRLQIIAEAKAFAESGKYMCSHDTYKKMATLVRSVTPKALREQFPDYWLENIDDFVGNKVEKGDKRDKWLWVQKHRVISSVDADEFVEKACKQFGSFAKVQTFKESLSKRGLKKEKFPYWNGEMVRSGYMLNMPVKEQETLDSRWEEKLMEADIV